MEGLLWVIFFLLIVIAWMVVRRSSGYTDPLITGLPIGRALMCKANDPFGKPPASTTYRYMGGYSIASYPTPTIADSWDTNWHAATNVDCAGMTKAPDMMLKSLAEMPVGKSLRCRSNDPDKENPGLSIYRYMGDMNIRSYKNPLLASKWDADWASPVTMDCTGLKKGPDIYDPPSGSKMSAPGH